MALVDKNKPLQDEEEEKDEVKIIQRGVIYKLARNRKLLPRWHRRYGVLNSEGHLYLYTDELMRNVRRFVDLQETCLRFKYGDDTTDDYCKNWPKNVENKQRLSLINIDRTYHFYFESLEDAEVWQEKLQEVLEKTAGTGFRSNWTTKPQNASLPPEIKENRTIVKPAIHHILAMETQEVQESVSETIIEIGEDTVTVKPDNETAKIVQTQKTEGVTPSKEEYASPYDVFSGGSEMLHPASVKDRMSTFEIQASSNSKEPPFYKSKMEKGAAQEQSSLVDDVSSLPQDNGIPNDNKEVPIDKEVNTISVSNIKVVFANTSKLHVATSVNDANATKSPDAAITATTPPDAAITATTPPDAAITATTPPGAAITATTPPGAAITATTPSHTAVTATSPIKSTATFPAAPSTDLHNSVMEESYEAAVHRLSSKVDKPTKRRSTSKSRQSWPPGDQEDEKILEKEFIKGGEEVLGEQPITASQERKMEIGLQRIKQDKEKHQEATIFEDLQENTKVDVVSPTKYDSIVHPTMALSSVPESEVSTSSSVLDKVNAFRAAGSLSPPPLPGASNLGSKRHRRTSEPPVKVSYQSHKQMKIQPQESGSLPKEDEKKGMTKFYSTSTVTVKSEPMPWEKEDENKDRVLAAAKWVDNEIRKLIHEIMRLGRKNENDQWEVEFGILFEETVNEFEALSGILKTAKKHKVLTYDGELLFQKYHDHVVITLLTESIEDSAVDKYTTTKPKGLKRTDLSDGARKKTSGFSAGTAFTGNAKCYICSRSVYATEFVAANDKAMHKACFKCEQCGKKLTPSAFATINNKFYCIPHYERLYMEKGDYSKL